MHETVLHRRSPNRWTTSPTCMLIYLLNPPFMFCMQFLSLLLSLSVSMHFINLLAFSFPSVSQANLSTVSAFTKAALQNMEKEGSPSSPDLHNLAQHWPPILNCTFLEASGCLAQKFAQICPWANSLSQLESCIPQPEQPTTQMDYAFCSSSYQLVSQQPELCLV